MFEPKELRMIFDSIHGELEENLKDELGHTSVEMHELAPELFDLPEKEVVSRQTILKKIIKIVWPTLGK
jgi:transposase